jgi:hypothetical protein
MSEDEIYWRQAFRMQSEITMRLARSLMATAGDDHPTVYALAYHVKEKTARMLEIHDENYPYDYEESR